MQCIAPALPHRNPLGSTPPLAVASPNAAPPIRRLMPRRLANSFLPTIAEETEPTAPITRKSSRLNPTSIQSPTVTRTPASLTNDVEIRQIVRKFTGSNTEPAYLVSYAPEFNATQEHIDSRIQADVPARTRASRISRVSGDHPYVVDTQTPNAGDPNRFTVTYKDGPELSSSLHTESGTPSPLLREHLAPTAPDTAPAANHARPGRILPSGVTPSV